MYPAALILKPLLAPSALEHHLIDDNATTLQLRDG